MPCGFVKFTHEKGENDDDYYEKIITFSLSLIFWKTRKWEIQK